MFLLLADTEPVRIQEHLIDLSKTENCVCLPAPYGSRIIEFLLHDWFVHKLKTKGKECGLLLTSHLLGGVLHDETKNGCVAD